MTYDRHVRIRDDGTIERLRTIGLRVASEDADEDRILEAAHLAEMQEIAQELADNGFGLTINAMLRAGLA